MFHVSLTEKKGKVIYSSNNEFKAAEKWATLMGKLILCLLVQELMDRNRVKSAYGIVKKNDLRKEFLNIYQKCEERYFDDPYAPSFFFALKFSFGIGLCLHWLIILRIIMILSLAGKEC